jgi:aminoglycoside phosphotransferase (APT) family kinase protein
MTTALDPRAVLAALGYPGDWLVTPLSGGFDTAMFRVERGDEACALRVFRPEQLAMSRGEMRAMAIAADGGVPVPRVLAHGVWRDRPALLLSWCEGRMVIEEVVERPGRAVPLGAACGHVLAAIHAIVVPQEYRDRSWLDWPRRPAVAGALSPGPRARLEAVTRHDRLLHLDFHPLNVLTDGEQVTAVLDWGNAHAGDPRADLARTLSILRLDAVAHFPDLRPVIRAFERGLCHAYGVAAGRPADMPLFHAWAGRAMLRDLAPRLAANPAQRARIERWTARWEDRVEMS